MRGTVASLILIGLLGGLFGCDTGAVADLRIYEPSPGDTFTRDTLGIYGGRVAVVRVDVVASGVARTVLMVEDQDVADGRGNAEVNASGDVNLVIAGVDASGEILVRETVPIIVNDPPISQCTGWLDLFGVTYQSGPPSPGIANPITADTPIVGIEYRSSGAPTPRPTVYGDCTLIRSLAESAGALRRREVTEVVDTELYSYRCPAGDDNTPPNCNDQPSQHALGTAIDITGYILDGGDELTIASDWIADAEGQSTCGAPTDNERDELLHELVCAQRQAGLWSVALTPNQGMVGMFHLDLTSGERAPVDGGPNLH